MKRALLLCGSLLPALVIAQTPAPVEPVPLTPAQEAVRAFAVRPPDEGSVFFSEREVAKEAMAAAATTGGNPNGLISDEVAVYPRTKDSSNTAPAILKSFFTDMFSSVKLKSLRGEKTTSTLTVLPEEFSVDKNRELETTYTVQNNTGKMIRLDYTTTQRVEITTRDQAGNVIDRWSDDRVVKPQEGIVIINPKERIQYTEPVSTRDMKPGETYTIQAEVAGYPDYSVTKPVTPTP